MKDNEIIKALECCTKGTISDVCVDCPLRTTDICTEEENGVLKLALDLINRQQAEIERLKKLLEEADISYNKCAKRFYKDGVKDFAKMLIDKSENGAVSISDLPDLVREWSDNNAE